MKLRCVVMRRSRTERSGGSGLTVGKLYDALELEVSSSFIRVRVVDDDGQPTQWMFDGFELVDSQVPSTWHASLTEDGVLTLGPQAWQDEGFWWAYFDDQADAIANFERGRSAMVRADRS